MTEKPIIFQGHSVIAILSGEKTQTRRVIKPQPIEDVAPEDCTGYTYLDGTRDKDGVHITKFTKYCPEMRLWVREAWRIVNWNHEDGTIAVQYKADDEIVWKEPPEGDDGERFTDLWIECSEECIDAGIETGEDGNFIFPDGVAPTRWRNPLFMPRYASRITLEVTDVRIQRLHDISEEDAMAEGVTPVISKKIHGWTPCVLEFYLLWNEINGKKYPWKSNPYVYALSFREVEESFQTSVKNST